jgi:hypothetical protein
LIGEVHQSEAGDRGIERGRLDVELLTVELPGLHGGQPGAGSRDRGVSQNCRGDVGGQHGTGGTDQPRGRQRLPPGSGRDVEDRAAGADAGGVEHPRDAGKLLDAATITAG